MAAINRLSIFVTKDHSSVSVQDADYSTREASAPSTGKAIDNLCLDDRRVLRAFCLSVVAYMDDGDKNDALLIG